MFDIIRLLLVAIIIAYVFSYITKEEKKLNNYFLVAFIATLVGHLLFRFLNFLTFSFAGEIVSALLGAYIIYLLSKNKNDK